MRIDQRLAKLAPAYQYFGQPGRRLAVVLQGARQQRLAGQRGQRRFSEGFQTTALPHTSASAAFQDQTPRPGS